MCFHLYQLTGKLHISENTKALSLLLFGKCAFVYLLVFIVPVYVLCIFICSEWSSKLFVDKGEPDWAWEFQYILNIGEVFLFGLVFSNLIAEVPTESSMEEYLRHNVTEFWCPNLHSMGWFQFVACLDLKIGFKAFWRSWWRSWWDLGWAGQVEYGLYLQWLHWRLVEACPWQTDLKSKPYGFSCCRIKLVRLNVYFCSDTKSLQLPVFGCVSLRLVKTRKKLSILEIPCWRVWSDKLLLAAWQIGLDFCCLLPFPCCCVWFALVNGLWACVTTAVKNFGVKNNSQNSVLFLVLIGTPLGWLPGLEIPVLPQLRKKGGRNLVLPKQALLQDELTNQLLPSWFCSLSF